MAGTLMAMPCLIINMGGEMVYILHQRLAAQSIPKDKSHKVLHDVLKTMYNKKFITALFQPQPVYTNTSVRQVFDRLAHSSIMRLNETSMDKLYDLMTMGYKYQLLTCNGPEHYVQITLNHLDNVRAMLVEESVIELVDQAQRLVIEHYASMTAGTLYQLKQTLLKFFDGRKVKVSIFLQEKVQNMDGTFKIRTGGPVVSGGEKPGTYREYSSSGRVVNTTPLKQLSYYGENCTESSNGDHISDRVCNLGNNMYANEKDPNLEPYKGGTKRKAASTSAQRTNREVSEAPKKKQASYNDGAVKITPTKHTSGRAELNLLANLLGSAVKETEGKSSDDSGSGSKPYSINLFLGDDLFGANTGNGRGTERESQRVHIDAKATRKSARQQMQDLGFGSDSEDSGRDKSDGGAKYGDDDSDDDLLGLMDEASKK
eukprot:g6119.t1